MQPVVIADAEFGGVGLEVTATACGPSLLGMVVIQAAKARFKVGRVLLGVDFDSIFAEALPVAVLLVQHAVEAAKIGLAIVAASAPAHAGKGLLGAERRLVIVRLQLHVVVGIVQKPDEPVYLIPGLFAELPYGDEDRLRGNVGSEIKLTSWLRSGGDSYAILEST
jgi:hypothetical protein